MKRLALTVGALAALACVTAPVSASDGYYRWIIKQNNHVRHHDDLDHRAFNRELRHREVHRYPMTYRQHDRLHDSLDHEAFHGRLEHREAHCSHAYTPYYRHGSASASERPAAHSGSDSDQPTIEDGPTDKIATLDNGRAWLWLF